MKLITVMRTHSDKCLYMEIYTRLPSSDMKMMNLHTKAYIPMALFKIC